MTPADKAKELYDKMMSEINCLETEGEDIRYKKEVAKGCAILTVREIFSNGMSGTPMHWYWNEVMNEINKL
jgi:hypothetical protein